MKKIVENYQVKGVNWNIQRKIWKAHHKAWKYISRDCIGKITWDSSFLEAKYEEMKKHNIVMVTQHLPNTSMLAFPLLAFQASISI